MKSRLLLTVLFTASVFLTSTSAAQQTAPASSLTASQVVPSLINYSGILKDASGRTLTNLTGVAFLLYKDEQGGAPLWLETQSVTPDKTGRYTVQLGTASKNGIPPDLFMNGEARWLAVQIGNEAEQPRVLLVAVPYAMKSVDAQTLGGLPASAFVLATLPASGAAATESSAASSSAALPAATSGVTTTGGTANTIPMFTTGTNIQNSILTQTAATAINVGGKLNLPASGTATATAGFNSRPLDFVASVFNSSTATPVAQTFQWQAEPANNDKTTATGTLNLLYATGTATPAETGLKINNKGLFTFAAGQTFPGTGTVTTVTAGAGLAGGKITKTGTISIPNAGVTNTMLANSSLTINPGTDLTGGGPVSLGGTTTLNVDTTKVPQLAANNTFTGATNAFAGNVTAANLAATGAVSGATASFTSSVSTATAGTFSNPNPGPVLSLLSTGTTPILQVSGDGSITAGAAAALFVNAAAATTVIVPGIVAWGGNANVSGNNGSDGIDAAGGSANGSSGAGGAGVTAGGGSGGLSTGNGGPGVAAIGGLTGVTTGTGGAGGTFTGAFGATSLFGGTGPDGDGIDATNQDGGTFAFSGAYAGNFTGDIHVSGAVFAGTKDFKIDHPLDPANKYLFHASVESSEMMNIYTGNVVLDANGEAGIELPDWFEALNRDFRYQLTAIGKPGPGLYVSEEISGHHFSIAGGAPGAKVSWQVTGVRQDAYAKAYPLVVEQFKPARERGYYIHPELFGAPEEKQIEWARNPDWMRSVKEQRAQRVIRTKPAAQPLVDSSRASLKPVANVK